MFDKTPIKKGSGHNMMLRDRGISKNVKKSSEKLQQYKKAISVEQTLRPITPQSNYSKLQNFTENPVYKEMEFLEATVISLENEQKQSFPMFDVFIDSFVVVFAHPTHNMTYFVNTDFKLKLECKQIESNLLYKNENEIIINRPKPLAFKLQLNDVIVDTIDTIEYDIKNEILILTAPVQNFQIEKSIIYFNILYNNNAWTVPDYMRDMFNQLPLEPPVKTSLAVQVY
ncbi:hypothetical protein [Palpita vitrealis nucleopolyhedrovirus]|uniref:Uncharacterized protein n=1 Tax=Palpita vitrealis nucleopolyhedrovirus TaxID=2951960 RepID=A0AAE9LNM3_9ABAC|nr:hypothetical protein [Palpita vitrealis nucleopolyhedrovirus]